MAQLNECSGDEQSLTMLLEGWVDIGEWVRITKKYFFVLLPCHEQSAINQRPSGPFGPYPSYPLQPDLNLSYEHQTRR
jgi:hypothetical protein